jgi:hypothetical protein
VLHAASSTCPGGSLPQPSARGSQAPPRRSGKRGVRSLASPVHHALHVPCAQKLGTRGIDQQSLRRAMRFCACRWRAPQAQMCASLAPGRGKAVVSNATRWDTFEGLMAKQALPKAEQLFRGRYVKSPSFLSIHMGVRADALPEVSGFPSMPLQREALPAEQW